MLKRITYLFSILILAAALQAAGQSYVIDKVCVGSERQYRVDGENGSSFEWLLYNDQGNQVPITNSSGDTFLNNNPDGSITTGSEISILWNKAGLYDLVVVQTSFLDCDTLEQGQIEVWDQPVVLAGNPLSICSGSKVEMTEAMAMNYSSLLWTTSGDGYFDSSTSLNTGYTGGPLDLAAGKVKLTLTAMGMATNTSCTNATSTLSVTFRKIPVLIVTDPPSVCVPQTIDLSAASVTAGSDPSLVFEYFTDAFATIPLVDYKNVSKDGVYYILATNADMCSVLKQVNVVFDKQYIPSFASMDEVCLNSIPPVLPPSSYNGITGKWSPATISTSTLGTADYTFTPDPGQCAADYTMSVLVSNSIVPKFSIPDQYCLASTPDPLPVVSNNGITGTWSPVSISTASIGKTTYTFTPDAGQCGEIVKKEITIILPGSPPTFSFQKVLCQNSVPPKLPTVSDGGVSGTWSPSVITTNTVGTKTYVFTPSGNQCVQQRYESIQIIQKEDPEFDPIGPFCFNSVPAELPKISKNGIKGTWSPSVVSTKVSGTSFYTFTPDASECANNKSLEIEIYDDIRLTVTAKPLLVFGGTTEVTVTATGGSGNYVSGTGVSYPGAGTHTFTVIDDHGCSNSKDISIIDPQDFKISVDVFGEPCKGGFFTLQVNVSGGTRPYTYTLKGGDPSAYKLNDSTYLVLASVNPYEFEVFDANGLFARSEKVLIDDPEEISLAISATATSCIGEANGSATVVASLGDLPYTYLWNDPLKQTTPTAIGLRAGTYEVSVQDKNGCIAVKKQVVVADPPEVTLLAKGTDPICPGFDGTIELTLTNVPNGQYDILYDFSLFSGVQVVSNKAVIDVPSGIYKNLRISMNGCTSASGVSVVLTEPAKQTITEFLVQPNCVTTTGSVIVTSPANNTGFVYSIDNGSYFSSGSFTGLNPGTHLIKVKKSVTGCETEKTITINPVPNVPATPVLAVLSQPDCIKPYGVISITSPLGTNFQYSSDGVTFKTSPLFSGLAPGNYTFTVQDVVTKCKSVSSSVSIDPIPNPPLVGAEVISQPDCYVTTGIIEFNGTLESYFEYSINGVNYQKSPRFEGLIPGTYYTTVKDLNSGCEYAVATLTINPALSLPGLLEASISVPTSCSNAEATISVSKPLGVDYEYSKDGITYQTSPVFTKLPAGDYSITVRHRTSLCVSDPVSLSIEKFPDIPADLVAIPVLPECETKPVQTLNANSGIVPPPNGIIVRWYDDSDVLVASPVLNKPGTVTYYAEAVDGVCVSANKTAVTLTINPTSEVLVKQNPYVVCAELPVQTIDARTVVSVDPGVTLNWYDAAVGGNLVANPVLNKIGTVVYYAETTNGKCSSLVRTPITLTIQALPDTPVAEVTASPNCKNEGGVLTVLSPIGNEYEYRIDGGTYQQSPVFSDLSSASYKIMVRNVLTGCESTAGTFALPPAPLPPVIKKVTVEDCICYGDSGAINFEFENISDGSYVVIYQTGKFQNVKVVNNKAQVKALAGRYDILAIEANGCTSTQAWSVELTQPDRLFASAEITKIDLKSQQQGEIDLNITGGTGIYEVKWAPNTISGFLGAATEDLANLKDGDYEVTITDQNGCQWQEIYTIPMPNLPPIATNDEFYTKCSRATGNLLYLDNGSDVDSDPDLDDFSLDLKPVSNPSHGYVTFYADGSFEYQAIAGYAGDDSFSYTIFDVNRNYSIPAKVTIHVVADFDGDGIADADDLDADGDGILNSYEGDITRDTDGDGLPDYLDIDSDGDGIVDNIEAQTSAAYREPRNLDVNHNGLDDAYESVQGGYDLVPVDSDGDGISDFIDFDSDNDLVPDYIEGHDFDSNGKPDYFAAGKDSDGDGLDDAYDTVYNDCNALNNSIGTNASIQDFDLDGKPDWRDEDDDDDGYVTRFEDLNADGDYSNDDTDFDGNPEYLDFGRECDLFIPDAFSPNGDNIHEYFQVYCMDHFPNAVMYIFDGLGNKLFEKANYGNLERWGTPDQAWWDGKSQNRKVGDRNGKVPPGTYYYVLKLGNGEVKKSYVFVSY